MSASGFLDFLLCGKLTTTGFILIVTLIFYVLWMKIKYRNSPPSYGGWIPYVGCAVEFGKSPLDFIEQSRKRLGPVFTLKVAGRRLTFLMDPDDYKHFFTSNKVDFQKAVQEPVQNTAHIPQETFFKHHTKIHDIVKWRLGQGKLLPICRSLNLNFSRSLDLWGKQGSGDLNGLVRSAMYKGVLDNLFGEKVLPTTPEESFRVFEKHFVRFDEDFEYGSQLPGIFLKEWSKSRAWLMELFGGVTQQIKTDSPTTEEETLFETLVKSINDQSASKFSLLMMWAALANAIPITFWTLAFMLTKPECLKKAKAQLKKVVAEKACSVRDPGSELELTEEDIAQLPYIKQCMLEAIRLRSPGVITRYVQEPLDIKGYTVPVGDLLMLSPYWSHRNEDFFPNPEEFQPERWDKADLAKNNFLEGFVAFGGGRYQCPGRVRYI